MICVCVISKVQKYVNFAAGVRRRPVCSVPPERFLAAVNLRSLDREWEAIASDEPPETAPPHHRPSERLSEVSGGGRRHTHAAHRSNQHQLAFFLSQQSSEKP
jgi:hypothetical protein